MSEIINNEDVNRTELELLPKGCQFSTEARDAIKNLKRTDIVACPGSGKTTMLLSKISVLSNRLPYEDNKGICVLSHTNVAVDEIKCKISDVGLKLNQYPNYIGTIQSFVHKFIVFPFLSSIYHVKPRILSNEKYNQVLYRIYNNKKDIWSLKGLIKNNIKNSMQDITENEFLCSLYIDFNDNSKLKAGNSNRSLGGKDSKSNLEFRKLKNTIWRMGIISYADAYILTELAMKSNSEALSKIISKRFKYVFVDEYQDCSDTQSNIISTLFGEDGTILQRIGDPDQAIYSSYKDSDVSWHYEDNYLPISGSRRYGTKIASIVSSLRLDDMEIKSYANSEDLKPHLIVFDENSTKEVLPTFAEIIENNKLHEKENAVFKAVGMIRNGNGLNINDYWDYKYNEKGSKTKLSLLDYILKLYQSQKKGCVRTMLDVFYQVIAEVINESISESYSTSSIKSTVKSSDYYNEFKEFVIYLIKSCDFDDIHLYIESANLLIKDKLYKIVNKIFEIEIDNRCDFNQFNQVEIDVLVEDTGEVKSNNFMYESRNGEKFEIEVSTVHKVKGETHTATLYLETEISRGSDLKRVLPLMQGKKLGTSKLHKKSRKIVYVGMSRPIDLLCVAIKRDTYEMFMDMFKEQWEILEL